MREKQPESIGPHNGHTFRIEPRKYRDGLPYCFDDFKMVLQARLTASTTRRLRQHSAGTHPTGTLSKHSYARIRALQGITPCQIVTTTKI